VIPSNPLARPSPAPSSSHPPHPRRLPAWLAWAGGTALLLLVVAAAVVAYVLHNAEPILRRRVIASLEARFRSPVELDALHISLLRGLQVSGSGLRIFSFGQASPPNQPPAGAPLLLSVQDFAFHTGLRDLFQPVMRISTVTVHGMQLTIPPKQDRPPFPRNPFPGNAKLSILLDKIVCSDITLTIATNHPGKQPLVFLIHNVTLHDVGPGQAFPFAASLVNPKPVGDIQSTGHLGPWRTDQPRDTPVDGVYSFTNADLATIRGISGTLSSTGQYSGTLGQIGVSGATDTPDFALDLSQHPVDLRTQFNATVDGTTGDTTLNHIHATLLHTVLDVTGSVIRASDLPASEKPAAAANHLSGHLIDLSVTGDQARVEDLLRLGAKTSPPLMLGALTLRARVTIPPGRARVSQRLRVQGAFTIHGVTFTSPQWQQMVDRLSARASGNPEQAKPSTAPPVTSAMSGTFAFADAILNLPTLNYQTPGATVDLTGKYGLDSQALDFAGTVRTQATASQMLTGWKSLLALPFDRLLKKNGAGLQVPIRISGTRSAPKLNLDFDKLFAHSAPASPAQPAKPVPAQHP